VFDQVFLDTIGTYSSHAFERSFALHALATIERLFAGQDMQKSREGSAPFSAQVSNPREFLSQAMKIVLSRMPAFKQILHLLRPVPSHGSISNITTGLCIYDKCGAGL